MQTAAHAPDHRRGAQADAQLPLADGSQPHLFWGDLHNHNAVGYAQGSLERSIDLAREHLDLCAFTGLVEFTGVFTSESFILHRLVGAAEYAATIRWQDRRPAAASPEWYYVRVTQHNGQMAWSSPIWVG